MAERQGSSITSLALVLWPQSETLGEEDFLLEGGG